MIPAGKFLDRAGVPAATAANVFGILAHATDATAATSGTVYFTGSFLRDLIVAANSTVTIDAAYEDAFEAQGDLSSNERRDISDETSRQLDHDEALVGQRDRNPGSSRSRLGRIKHRCSDAEAQEICRRREELRAEAPERGRRRKPRRKPSRWEGKRQSILPNHEGEPRAWHDDPRLSICRLSFRDRGFEGRGLAMPLPRALPREMKQKPLAASRRARGRWFGNRRSTIPSPPSLVDRVAGRRECQRSRDDERSGRLVRGRGRG